jgi:hypothetical protein
MITTVETQNGDQIKRFVSKMSLLSTMDVKKLSLI